MKRLNAFLFVITLCFVAFFAIWINRKMNPPSDLGAIVRKERSFIIQLNAARKDKVDAIRTAAMWEATARKLQDENHKIRAIQIIQQRKNDLQKYSPAHNYTSHQIDSVCAAIARYRQSQPADFTTGH